MSEETKEKTAPRSSKSAHHQTQYGEDVARFFDIFNQLTGRRELYQGYLAGYLGQKSYPNDGKNIAVDFGCGTGWLARNLTQYNFTHVYGIDSSKAMLEVAFQNAGKEIAERKSLRFLSRVPAALIGQCRLVTSVHVHYHFVPYEKLETGFFGTISSLLKKGGESILIGCPSDYIGRSPVHYQNSVHIKDVPASILEQRPMVANLKDNDGYIPLSTLPNFSLAEGTQMKVTFKVKEPNGTEHTANLLDTYWSDEALIKAAKTSNLELICKRNLTSGDYPNAYMVMHFKKTSGSAPPSP